MSDKIRWAGPRAGSADWSMPVVSHYVTAKVTASSKTHVGLMVNGFCFQLCNNTKRTILLPVPDEGVECEHCQYIMRRDKITVNMSVKFEPV